MREVNQARPVGSGRAGRMDSNRAFGAGGSAAPSAHSGGGAARPPARGMERHTERRGSSYAGVERRLHRICVTRNTEYHFRGDVCIAVRDRRTGDWLPGHLALRRQLFGSIQFFTNGAMSPHAGEPRLGEALFFAQGGRDLITSPLEKVERPPKHLVEAYAY